MTRGVVSKAALLITLVAVLFTVPLTPGCSGNSPEDVALQAARDWSQESMNSIADEIGDSLAGDIPLLSKAASAAIEDQIRDGISWTFSTPVEKSERRYEVVATAHVPIEFTVPLFGDYAYDVRLDWILDVDIDKEEVVDSRMDLSSLEIQER